MKEDVDSPTGADFPKGIRVYLNHPVCNRYLKY